MKHFLKKVKNFFPKRIIAGKEELMAKKASKTKKNGKAARKRKRPSAKALSRKAWKELSKRLRD